MARTSKSSALSRTFRRTKAFLYFNVVLWAIIGGWYLFQPAVRQREVSQLVGNLFDGRKEISALDVAWDLWQLYYGADYVRTPLATGKSPVYGGMPATKAGTLRILTNTGYVVGYSETLGSPLWAAYRVSDIDLQASPPRPDEFRSDSRTVARIEPAVYNNSGYDRGHLAPNYAIATHYGKEAQAETFLMSNIMPQKHALNAGLWKTLEQKIATSYPGRFGEVWVFAGPVFGPQPAKLRDRVTVPESCYMIILDESDGRIRAEAFLFPQETTAGRLGTYLTSIDEIERRTGLDFFAALPDDAETALEARKVDRAW